MRTFTIAVLFLLCNGGGSSSPATIVSGQWSNNVNRTTTVVQSLPMESSEITENAFLAPKVPFTHPSADVPMDLVSKRKLYTLAFFVETLSTGSDVHLIRSNVFDLPSDRDRLVAISVARLWSKLSIMGRLNDILSATSAATAERYVNANDDLSAERANIFQFHYNITEEKMKVDPTLSKIYAKVWEEVQRASLPPLASGTIDLRNVKTILRRAETAYLTNVKLRRVYLNLKFAYRAFSPVKKYSNRTAANAYVDDNSLLAQAIMLLMSTGSKVADKVQSVYDQAIEVVLRIEATNPREFGVSHATMENFLFLTLSRMLENDLILNPKLVAAKRQLRSANSSMGIESDIK